MTPLTDPHEYHAVFRGHDGGNCRESSAALLEYAFRLWSEGHEVPAAVMARAAVEHHVTWLCAMDYRLNGYARRPQLGCRLYALTRCGVLDRASDEYLLKAISSLHAASHGKPVTFEKLADGLRIAAVFCRLEPTLVAPEAT